MTGPGSAPLTEALTVGLGLFTGQAPTSADAPPYRSAIELAVAAEASGFDAFWVSEHHGWTDGYLPSPLTVLAAVAARTSTLILGTGVCIAPVHHPIRLAEDAAVVDHLSEGRLILGLGIGYVEAEYRMFGVDPRWRGTVIEDTVRLLRVAWRGDPFDWAGAAITTTDATVTPVPVRGTVPVWLGGYSASAVRRAAQIGDGYLMGRSDETVLSEVEPIVHDSLARPATDFVFAVNVLVNVTDDEADAMAVRRAFQHQQLTYEAVQRGRRAHAGLVADSQGAGLSLGTADAYFQAVGTADTVAEQIRTLLGRLARWPRVHVALRVVFPESDVAGQLHRIDRLGRDLLPLLRVPS